MRSHGKRQRSHLVRGFRKSFCWGKFSLGAQPPKSRKLCQVHACMAILYPDCCIGTVTGDFLTERFCIDSVLYYVPPKFVVLAWCITVACVYPCVPGGIDCTGIGCCCNTAIAVMLDRLRTVQESQPIGSAAMKGWPFLLL